MSNARAFESQTGGSTGDFPGGRLVEEQLLPQPGSLTHRQTMHPHVPGSPPPGVGYPDFSPMGENPQEQMRLVGPRPHGALTVCGP